MYNSISIRLSGTIAAVFLGSTTAYAAVSFSNLGVLPGFADTHAPGISSDGSTVAGFCQTSSGSYRAFRWTSTNGMQDIGVVSGLPRSLGFGTNSNGSVIVGSAETSNGSALSAFRWTQSGGMQSIGSDLVAYGVSGDGSAITGKTTTQFSRAFRWTSSAGVQTLGTLSGDSVSYGFGISGNGAVVVGQSQGSSLPRAFRWTSGSGMQDIGHLPGGLGGIAQGVSFDGSAVTGIAYAADGNGHAFRWTLGSGMQDLGILAGSGLPFSEALAISGDGSAVAGQSGGRAFLWKSSLGMVDLNVYLTTLGADLSGWTLERAYGLSADGSSICGEGTFNGQTRSWVALVPAPATGTMLAIAGLLATRRRR